MPELKLENLTKRFGGVIAVDDFSLTLPSGQLQAIIGPNGCGKSTLFNLICGATDADAGKISFGGTDITHLPAEKIARLGVVRKFQVPSIFPELTVAENLKLPLIREGAAKSGVNQQDILSLIRLETEKDQLASQLAHGQKQWLEIGMTLMQGPSLLLLDEPTAGMTQSETRLTAELILNISENMQTSVIVIEHDMAFIEMLSCPLLVMSKGRILKSGSYTDLRTDPEVQELYFGKVEASHA